jgi:hypothetical protein
MTEPRPPKNTEEVVEFFLGAVVMKEPKDPPKQQYRQRENAAEVRGYCKAQEDLRHFLSQIEGKTKAAERGRALAEERHPDQQQPVTMTLGGKPTRMWIG